MKRIFLAIVLLLFLSSFSWAGSITLEWDPNTESDLKCYNVYRAERTGDHSSAWKIIGMVPKDTTTYTDEVDGRNYAYMVTAVNDTEQESFPSNMVERYDRTPPMTVENCKKKPE